MLFSAYFCRSSQLSMNCSKSFVYLQVERSEEPSCLNINLKTIYKNEDF